MQFNIGMTYADMDDHRSAVDALQRSISLAHVSESHLRKAYAMLAASLSQLEDHSAADALCQSGLQLFPGDVELLFRQGLSAHALGQLERAIDSYLQVQNSQEQRHFNSIDEGLQGYKTRHNLALVYEVSGQFKKAEEQWRHALAEVPSYAAGWHGLIGNLIQQKQLGRATAEIERMPADERLTLDKYQLRSRLVKAQGDLRGACLQLEAGLRVDSAHVGLLEELCHLLFESGSLPDAERRLHELTRLAPANASAWQNLGAVHLRAKNYRRASECLRKALDISPHSAISHLYLGFALHEGGDREGAQAAWKEAICVQPASEFAQQAAKELEQLSNAIT